MNGSDFIIFHCCFHTVINAENLLLSIPNSSRAKESAGILSVGQTTSLWRAEIHNSPMPSALNLLSRNYQSQIVAFFLFFLFFIYFESILRRGILRQLNLE